MRPQVRPGTLVLRRDVTHLQLGTDPGVVLSDSPGLLLFLRGLDGTRDLDTLRRHLDRDRIELSSDLQEFLSPLITAGLVVDSDRPALRWPTVSITHDHASHRLAQTVSQLLERLQVPTGPEPDLLIVISSGEPARAPLADAVRCHIPHLVVVLHGDDVRIGPMVIPGQTACVGCLDLHRSQWDRAWLALVPQFGAPSPCGISAVTEYSAAAAIANEVLSLAHGKQTQAVGHRPHPRCTCALLSTA